MLQIRSLSELDSLSATGSVKEGAAHRRIPSRELDWNDWRRHAALILVVKTSTLRAQKALPTGGPGS